MRVPSTATEGLRGQIRRLADQILLNFRAARRHRAQGTTRRRALACLFFGNAVRPNLNKTLPLGQMSVEEIRVAAGRPLHSTRTRGVPQLGACFYAVTAAQRVGDVGRNTLRTAASTR